MKTKLSVRQCVECFRIFDMLDESDARDWTFGHDCEDEQ